MMNRTIVKKFDREDWARVHMDPALWFRWRVEPPAVLVTCPSCGAGSSESPAADGTLEFECLYPKCKFSGTLTLEGWDG